MQRQSQEALVELTTSDEIISSIETHGVEVASLLEEKWQAPSAPPDDSTPEVAAAASPPDYLGNLIGLRDGLNASANALNHADQAHVHQLGKLLELREEREQLRGSAFELFSTIRRAIEELHGEGKAFALAAFEGPTARTSKKLLRQIDLAVPLLFEPNLKLTDSKIEGITFDPPAMGSALKKLADKLRAKQAEYRRALRVAQATRKEKQRRIDEHKNNNLWTARIVEGYYQLAGESELAERLRPIVRRSGRPSAPTPPDSEPTPTPDEPVDPDGAIDASPPAEPPAGEPASEAGTTEGATPRDLGTNLQPSPSTADA